MHSEHLEILLQPAAMTDRTDYGYSSVNMVYPTQWTGSGQQSAHYQSAAYYGSNPYSVPHTNSRSVNASSSTAQNMQYAPYSPATPRSTHLVAPQPMYTHAAPQIHPHLHPRSPPLQADLPPAPRSPPLMGSPPLLSAQYPSEMGYGQSMGGMQYPASPNRPFSCDMCALSFNRQHDLKRHRETHSGEKPFLCNGGCGKTFTRKDALKRHQLVKQCGHDDDS